MFSNLFSPYYYRKYFKVLRKKYNLIKVFYLSDYFIRMLLLKRTSKRKDGRFKYRIKF